jgi:hypothetical protein
MRAPVSSVVAAKATTITAMNTRATPCGTPRAAMNPPPPWTKAPSFAPSPDIAPQLA